MPPLVEVAVKVTFSPEQMEVEVATMLTLAVNIGLTVIGIEFEVAIAGLAQVAFDVMVQ